MKKIFTIILSVLSITVVSINQIQATSIADFTPKLDKKIAKMETTQEKVEYLKSFSKLLTNSKYTQSKNAWLYKEIREYCLNMLKVFEYQLQEEQSNNTINTIHSTANSTIQLTPKVDNLPHLSDNFSNIDIQKIRNAILSRHNEERASLGRNSYQYSLDLEGSATTRANNLAISGKTKNLHARNTSDGYYNYNSMTNRFSNLGINFGNAPKGTAAFSETIGRNIYKCNKSDCTDELITAIKKTRTGLIMKEKSSNGSHYRAAVMKHFTQMGVGIAIDKPNNRYYLVIHYGVNF